jgi:hypothetical protein
VRVTKHKLCLQALVMQLYRRGSLARSFTTLWYQGLSEIQRLRFVIQVEEHQCVCNAIVVSISHTLCDCVTVVVAVVLELVQRRSSWLERSGGLQKCALYCLLSEALLNLLHI